MFGDDYTHNYGLTPYDNPLMQGFHQAEQQAESRDDRDEMLEAVTRFAALFCIGVAITLFARCFPALRPFYWIGVAGAFSALALGGYLGRNVKLISLTVAVAISIVAGHWDFIDYQGRQTVQAGQEVIQNSQKAIQERLP